MNNILIVEDEHLIARLIEMTLTRAGYRCTLAEDGRTAADLIETTNFDMALLDIMLPGLDGYALLECLRPQGVPVIFITAKSAVKDRVQGLRLAKADSTGMELAPLSGEPSGAVPQVVGMGIKEAIYLLEREGLRVAFSGTGCVRSQSIPAGAPAQRGALVVLQLGAGRPEVRPRAVKSDASAGPER